jgi:hypothetical protein
VVAKYRLTADLPEDPAERTHAMAKAFGMALHEAATSPDFRIEMILGEAFSRYMRVVDWLIGELHKEPAEVQVYARKITKTLRNADLEVVRMALLTDAVRLSLVEVPECPKITATGSTGS